MRGFGISLFSVMTLAACGSAVHTSPAAAPPPEQTQSQADRIAALPLNFSTANSEVIGPKCVGCHGKTEMVDLSSYPAVKSELKDIKSSVFGTGIPMPPVGKPQLTPCEKKILEIWMAAGALENSQAPVGQLAECR